MDTAKKANSNCRYCRENRMHPRLARGESYPCGYKPYRCEVCGYSTTTKGNLTIHLQSDKHANNVRVLQAAGKLPKRITIMPDCHVVSRQEQQDDLSRPWRCEPCGYSTNINSNLRIHLSSEKHAIAVRKLDAVFLCGICTKFTCETAERLEAHVNQWRHCDEDFGLQQQGDFFVCNLCSYKTQLKSNFAIHCKTDKHISRQQLAVHIREGGVTNEWRLRYLPQGLQLICQLCQFTAASWDGLKLHAASDKHQAQFNLYQKLKRTGTSLDCKVCGLQFKNTLQLVRHSMEHNHQLLAKPNIDVTENIQRQMVASPGRDGDLTSTQNCPLCMENVTGVPLDVHLKREHSVRDDVVNMMMVNLDNNYGRRLAETQNESELHTSHLLKQYLSPLRPFRCTICFESFEHDIGLQVHLLSPQHQERARPNIQKALLALQNNLKFKPEFEQSNPSQTTQGTMSTNSEAASATPTSKPEPSFTAVENSILEMLFSLNSEPPAELIDAAAGETGIDSAKIRLWLEMKKNSQKQGNDEKSDQSDSFSKENDFSDDESNGDKLKIDESATSEKAELKNPEPEVKQPKKETENDQSNRRMRTLISPDQAEVLYREYLEDNCPPRQRLEEIAAQTGLKRRVVQVWFQNTRARERKGQYRSVSMFAQKQAQQTTNTAQTTKNAQLSIKPKFPVSPASLLSLTDTLKQKEAEQKSPTPNDEPLADSEMNDLSKLSLPTLLSLTNNQLKQQLLNNNLSKLNQAGPSRSPSSLMSDSLLPATSSSSANQTSLDGSKRSRTQLTNGQVNAMQATFDLYRSPSLAECEILGAGIGLARRVVQVWFQNHRAKERRARAALGQTPEPPMPEPPPQCTICDVPIKGHADLRDHLFSNGHVQYLKKQFNIGAESPLSFDHFQPGATPTSSKAQTLPATPPPQLLSGLTPNIDQMYQAAQHQAAQQAARDQVLARLSNLSSSGILSTSQASPPAPTTPPTAPGFNLLNLKNLNANIQRIINAKAALQGSSLLGGMIDPLSSPLVATGDDTNESVNASTNSGAVVTEIP